MLKVLGHQGRSPGRADSKQHKTEPSDLQRLDLGKTIGKTRGVERLPFPTSRAPSRAPSKLLVGLLVGLLVMLLSIRDDWGEA